MPYTAHSNSPLIQQLRELALLDTAVPHSRFVAIVGKFIDFSEAMTVSEFLSDLPYTSASNATGISVDNGVAGLEQYYLQARGDMMHFIIQSFTVGDTPVPLRLPLAADSTFSHDDQGLSSYRRFYALHQSEMETSVLQLQTHTRRYLTASSPSLAQLAALDSQLTEVLLTYSRKALGVTSSLLAKRFLHLGLTLPSPAMPVAVEANSALQAFLMEMQLVLLAELEIRLQPTLGLIEALTLEQEESTT